MNADSADILPVSDPTIRKRENNKNTPSFYEMKG